MDSKENSDKQNKNKPTMKRRKFFFLFGASAVGLAMMSKSPFKFIGSIFSKSQGRAAGQAGTKGKNKSITVRENPYAVKRGPKNG